MSRSVIVKLVVLIAGLSLTYFVQRLPAQSVRHWSGGLSIGQGAAIGGDVRSSGRKQVIADLNLAYRISWARFGTPLVGVNYAAESINGDDLSCTADMNTGKCVPDYPKLYGAAAFVGWQTS